MRFNLRRIRFLMEPVRMWNDLPSRKPSFHALTLSGNGTTFSSHNIKVQIWVFQFRCTYHKIYKKKQYTLWVFFFFRSLRLSKMFWKYFNEVHMRKQHRNISKSHKNSTLSIYQINQNTKGFLFVQKQFLVTLFYHNTTNNASWWRIRYYRHRKLS